MASVEKRKNKQGEITYRITIEIGKDLSGKKVRYRKTYKPEKGMTSRQAEKEAHKVAFEFEEQMMQGYSMNDNVRFQDYAQYVLDLKRDTGLKLTTYERYQSMLPRINAAIGPMKLRDIRPMHLNNFYRALSQPGVRITTEKAIAKPELKQVLNERGISKGKLEKMTGVSDSTIFSACKGQPIVRANAEKIAKTLKMPYTQLFQNKDDATTLSKKTVLEHHRLIRTILSQAEKEMMVPYNAAKKATPPKIERKEVNYFQPEDIRDILEALESEPLKWQLMTNLLMITGARRGEIAGLKWEKIDEERQRVKINSTTVESANPEIGVYETSTKTGNWRYVPLPEETFALLKRYKAEQNRLRLLKGDRWQDNGYVFTTDDGSPIRPDTVTQWLSAFSKRRGLQHINPHAFRHTAASILVTQGIDIVTVSKMLGHARVSTTEDIYSHVIEASKELASNELANVYYRNEAVNE